MPLSARIRRRTPTCYLSRRCRGARVSQADPFATADDASLDRLSPAEVDALPFGVIQLDGAGRITAYNQAESRLSGRDPERVLGRDFFREVAPCTNMPAFRARFEEGVRRGGMDERFSFVFAFEPQAVRVDVRLLGSRSADRYWVTIRPQERLAPTPQRLADWAIEAVDRRARAELVDPSLCEREPIHIPGGVQPYMVMLACNAESAELHVESCSENVADAFDLSPGEVLGRPLATLVSPDVERAIAGALTASALDDAARPLRLRARLGSDESPFSIYAHRQDARVIVELERVAEHPEDFGAATPLQIEDAVAAVQNGSTLDQAAAAVATHLSAITGFERLLVYRFDADWNGEAIAETTTRDWGQSLLGLRFPASDIPAQARALYVRSNSRFVVDRDAPPAALLVDAGSSNSAVDLTYSQSRALSPIHLEYQRNMGVNGSMSVSIVVDGALWGLVIGHHSRPHYLPPESRAAASIVTRALALRVHELETVRLAERQQQHLIVRNHLLAALAGSEDYVAALTEGRTTMLQLVEASGAAVISGSRVATLGRTPDRGRLIELAARLAPLFTPDRRVFATDNLALQLDLAEFAGPDASGVLAASLDLESPSELLFWFRPELVSMVAWGGDPRKSVLAEASTRTVLPRRSFERWIEESRGASAPWAPWEISAAGAVAAVIGDVALQQGRRIAELTAQQSALTLALEQKNLLAREVDHRVKNSLQIVAGVMLMQARSVTDLAAKTAFQETYNRVMSVARVHDILHESEDLRHVDLGETLQRLVDDLAASMGGDGRDLAVEAEAGLMVSSQSAIALSLIATELVTNAVKYAYEPGEPGRVEVKARSWDDGKIELRVCDNGRGLPAETSSRTRRGLGLRVIDALLKQIGAEMTVENEAGACFTVRG